jgi:hypothetical protein
MDPFYIPADVTKDVNYKDTHLILESSIKFWSILKSSNNFFFVRKILPNSIVKFNFTDFSLIDMVKFLNLYDTTII